MLPPSWKGDIQKTVQEAGDAERQKREAEQTNAASRITTAIEALANAQATQTSHEDSHHKVNVGFNGVTIFLVFLTVIFTAASWYVFRNQLDEMKKVYEPIRQQAEVASSNLVYANRAWLIARNAAWQLMPNKAGDPMHVMILYENIGHGPALNELHYQEPFWIDFLGGSTDVKNVDDLNFPPNDTCSKVTKGGSIGVLWPNEGKPLASFGPEKTTDAPADFVGVKKLLGYHGCFVYETFKQTHRTAFCFILSPVIGKPIAEWVWGWCPGQDQNFAD